MLLNSSAFSQNLFTEISPESLPLSSLDSSRWNKFDTSAYTSATKFIQVGSLPNLIQNGTINFTIPGQTGTLTAETMEYDYTDDANYGWAASIENGTGNIIVVARDSSFVGLIKSSQGYFTIEYLKKGYGILVEHDLDEHTAIGDGCATGDGGGDPGPGPGEACEQHTQPVLP